MSKIIVIGRNTLDDYITLGITAEWFKNVAKRNDLALRLWRNEFEEYDMATKPERGDGIDAIDDTTILVVALHIFGIDQLPGRKIYGMDLPYTYCKRNGELLKICMDRGIPLVAWGDQPWYGLQTKTLIHENSLWIYEPFMAIPQQDTNQVLQSK